MTTNTFIFGAHRYRVVAPVVMVRLRGRGYAYVNEGAVLPGNALESHVDELLRAGMIEDLQGGAR